MKSLQIKKLPDHIYLKLSQLAESEHRSLAQQAVVTLAKGLELAADPITRRQNTIACIQQRYAQNSIASDSLPDPIAFLRQARDQ